MPFPEWDTFIKDLPRDFGTPLSHDTLGDMASPRHDVDLNDYIDTFHAYVQRVGITSELHRVHLFVTNLRDMLWATGLLAQALEGMAPTALNTSRALTDDSETALLAGLSDDNNHTTPNEQVGDPALATAAPTADFIRNIDPRNVNNIDRARQPVPLDPDDITDFTTLTILHQAVADDSKL
jgi:hypothetical protein